AAGRVVMGHRAAAGDHRVEPRGFDRVPLLDQLAVAAGRMEGEIRRRPVRVDVGEAAGDLALLGDRVADRLLGRRLDAVVKALEPLPGERGRERVVDDAAPERALARVRYADE